MGSIKERKLERLRRCAEGYRLSAEEYPREDGDRATYDAEMAESRRFAAPVSSLETIDDPAWWESVKDVDPRVLSRWEQAPAARTTT